MASERENIWFLNFGFTDLDDLLMMQCKYRVDVKYYANVLSRSPTCMI